MLAAREAKATAETTGSECFIFVLL